MRVVNIGQKAWYLLSKHFPSIRFHKMQTMLLGMFVCRQGVNGGLLRNGTNQHDDNAAQPSPPPLRILFMDLGSVGLVLYRLPANPLMLWQQIRSRQSCVNYPCGVVCSRPSPHQWQQLA